MIIKWLKIYERMNETETEKWRQESYIYIFILYFTLFMYRLYQMPYSFVGFNWTELGEQIKQKQSVADLFCAKHAYCVATK